MNAAGPGERHPHGRDRPRYRVAARSADRGPDGGPVTGHTVGIVGAGAVGQTVATLLVGEPWCIRLLITSCTAESAAGLVADLDDMAHVVRAGTRTQAATVAELDQADAVVVCPRATFANTATRNVRMAGLDANARCSVRQPRGRVARNPVTHPRRSPDRSASDAGPARDSEPAHGPHQTPSRLYPDQSLRTARSA